VLVFAALGCARERPDALSPHDALRPWVTPADYAWPPRSTARAADRSQPDRDALARSFGDPITRPDRELLLSDTLLPGGEACLAQLEERQLPVRPTEVSRGVDTPVVVSGPIGGVEFWSPAGPMVLDCRLALALSRLAPHFVRLGIVRVRFSGAYVYRTSRTGRLSLHAYGLALDVHEVSTAQRTYSVKRDYARGVGESCSPEAALLNRLACALRSTRLLRELLTPDYDGDHHDHFHLGIAPLPNSAAVARTGRAAAKNLTAKKAPPVSRATASASVRERERTAKNRLGKRRAKVEAARERRDHGAVGVASAPSSEGVASLRADLEELAKATRDGLHGAAADQPGELLPVEAERGELLQAGAPQ
jgi:hypothetical protein